MQTLVVQFRENVGGMNRLRKHLKLVALTSSNFQQISGAAWPENKSTLRQVVAVEGLASYGRQESSAARILTFLCPQSMRSTHRTCMRAYSLHEGELGGRYT